MPYLLTDLIIDRVDLVDDGANSEAFIELYKRKEPSVVMKFEDIIAKLNDTEAQVIKDKCAELEKMANEAKEKEDAACTKVSELETELENKKKEDDMQKVAFDETETFKALPEEIKEYVVKMREQKEAAEAIVLKAKEDEAIAKANTKAQELKSLPVENSKLVDVLKNASTEVVEILTEVAKAFDETILGEVGKNKKGQDGSTGNTAWDQIESIAIEKVKENSSITKAKAITMVLTENPDLYKKYLEEGAN